MGRDRDPYERTVDLLRRRLRAGAFGHGQPLQILKLAKAIGVSSTPIREALARLAGEGLVDRAASGYLTPRRDAASVADLYRLDEVYALAAMAGSGGQGEADVPLPPGPAGRAGASSAVERIETLLARIGSSDNPTLLTARRNLWDRLAPFRLAEAAVFDDFEAELTELARGFAGRTGGEHRRLIRRYYRRRTRAAVVILVASLDSERRSNIP